MAVYYVDLRWFDLSSADFPFSNKIKTLKSFNNGTDPNCSYLGIVAIKMKVDTRV